MSYPITLAYYCDWNMDGIINVFSKGNGADDKVSYV